MHWCYRTIAPTPPCSNPPQGWRVLSEVHWRRSDQAGASSHEEKCPLRSGMRGHRDVLGLCVVLAFPVLHLLADS